MSIRTPRILPALLWLLSACGAEQGRLEGSRALPYTIMVRPTGITIGGTIRGNGPDLVGPLTVDSRGRFLAATREPGTFAIWNPDGSFLKVVGGPGQGPGEYEGQVAVWVDRWDSIHVRDGRSSWTVLGPDGEFGRRMTTGRMLFQPFTTVLPTGVAVVAFPRVPDHVFEVLSSADGGVSAAFGVPLPSESRVRRVLAPASDTTFWAAPAHRYRLEEWTVTGRRLRVIERTVPWFPPRERDEMWDGRGGPPPPVVAELFLDPETGLLWTRVMVPDGDYEESQGAVGGGLLTLGDLDELYDFVIEVLDPGTGRLLASRTSDRQAESVTGFLRPGLAYRIEETALGLLRYHILEVAVVPGPR